MNSLDRSSLQRDFVFRTHRPLVFGIGLLLRVFLVITLFVGTAAQASAQAGFDHSRWDSLLSRHVRWIRAEQASAVDYRGMRAEADELEGYLQQVAAVERSAFESWGKNEQLAFLINVYNAATVALIIENLDDIDSIRDIGSFFTSAWELERVALFGGRVTLDEIEHDMIRGWGRYNEPRIHFAVNCAAIGCPALQPNAYQGATLANQLEHATQNFLADRSRNYLDGSRLRLSSIFKWYREDFESGWGGIDTLEQFVARYAQSLGLSPQQAQQLEKGEMRIRFLSYDWGLNSL